MKPPIFLAKAISIAISLILYFSCSSVAQTFTSLWNDYVANPYNQPNIPNNSYAGYRTGTASLPNPAYTIYNIITAPFNAVANDAVNDQTAIQAARIY